MRFAVGLIGLLIVGCAQPIAEVDRQLPVDRIKSPSGRILCAVHRVPLTTARGWRSEAIIMSHPVGAASIKFEEDNPNRIPFGESLSKTKECPIAGEVTFCRLCEKGVGRDDQ